MGRILVPTDFSNKSEIAVDYAIELARQMYAQLTPLHVLPERSTFDYAMRGFSHGEWEQAKDEAEQKLAGEKSWNKIIGPNSGQSRASQHFKSFRGAWRIIDDYKPINLVPQRSSVLECGTHAA